MTVPDFQSLMRPLFVYAQDGKEKDIRETIKALADEFQLSERADVARSQTDHEHSPRHFGDLR